MLAEVLPAVPGGEGSLLAQIPDSRVRMPPGVRTWEGTEVADWVPVPVPDLAGFWFHFTAPTWL